MTDETILDPNEPIEEKDIPDEDAPEADPSDEPVEGDESEQDVEDEPAVPTAPIPPDAW